MFGQSGTVAPGQHLILEVTAANLGDTLWLHRPMRYGGHVRIGVQLLGTDGAMLDPDLGSAHLPMDVEPGGSVTVPVEIALPASAGAYTIRIDLVVEFITWFRDRGSRTCDVSIEVG